MTPDSKASWPDANSPSVKNQVLVTRGLTFISMGGKISSRTFLSRAETQPRCRCPDFLPPHGPPGPRLVSLPTMAVSCSLPACLLPLLFPSWSLLGSGPHLLLSRLPDRSHLPPTSDQSNEIDAAGAFTSPCSIDALSAVRSTRASLSPPAALCHAVKSGTCLAHLPSQHWHGACTQ